MSATIIIGGIPPKEIDEVSKQIKEWLKDGIIQPSSSDFAAVVVPVPKKDGTKRLCVDYIVGE